MGFGNVNVDLMSAIPGQTAAGWEKTLRKVAGLRPEHISAYSLIIEEGTPFYEKYGKARDDADALRDDPLPDEEEERQMYRSTKKILGEYGYQQYEISNPRPNSPANFDLDTPSVFRSPRNIYSSICSCILKATGSSPKSHLRL